MRAWTRDKPLRLHAKERPAGDTAAKALACYGFLLPEAACGQSEQMLVRSVSGRPLRQATCEFLFCVCKRLWEQGERVLLLVWDNASWHISQKVKGWVKEHNRQVKKMGVGLRLLVCPLPKRSPWLNRIEGKWVQGKRAGRAGARALGRGVVPAHLPLLRL